jgi:hypothetical protein
MRSVGGLVPCWRPPISLATMARERADEWMEPLARAHLRACRAGDPCGRLQTVENPGCVRLRHGEQCRDERSIGHRLHGRAIEDGQSSIVGGGEGGHDGRLTASEWSGTSGRVVRIRGTPLRLGALLVASHRAPPGKWGSGIGAAPHGAAPHPAPRPPPPARRRRAALGLESRPALDRPWSRRPGRATHSPTAPPPSAGACMSIPEQQPSLDPVSQARQCTGHGGDLHLPFQTSSPTPSRPENLCAPARAP